MLNNNQGCILAEAPRFGCVFDCGCCDNIHLTIGPVSLLLAPEDYMKLVAMIHTSASRFEAWLEEKRRSFDYRTEHLHARPEVDADPA